MAGVVGRFWKLELTCCRTGILKSGFNFASFLSERFPAPYPLPLIRSPGTLSAPGRGPRINLVLVSRVSGRHYDGDGKVSQVPVKPA